MPTTNTNFTSLITAIDTKAQALAASTTDPKDLVFLGKAVEALNVADTVSAVITEGDTQVAAVNTAGTTQLAAVNTAGTTQLAVVNTAGTTQLAAVNSAGTTQISAVNSAGTTQVAAVAAQGANYAQLAGATFTGAVTIPDLTVTGTTTTINSTTLDIADINITVANGAANSAAADGAGLTIEGAGVNFQWSDADQKMSLNKSLAVNGTLDIEEVYEKVGTSSTTSGLITFYTTNYGVIYYLSNQSANRTINFSDVNANLAIGQSVTGAVLMTQGSTAYYLNTIQVDGTTVTPKWQGGAPTEGNASGIDVYSFTIIKTADATFTVLASLAAFE